MRTLKILVALLVLVAMASTSCASGKELTISKNTKQIGFINFSNWESGQVYTLEMMKSEWNPRQYNGEVPIDFKGVIHDRVTVVDNPVFSSGKALQILLPKDKILPLDSGAQIFGFIGGYEAVYTGVSIYLPPDFQCGKEIKMPPGIYGGQRFATGGSPIDGVNIGPSIRMVIQECIARSYIYHLNKAGRNGDGSNGHPRYGDKFNWRHTNGEQVIVTKGERHDILSFAKMNTPGKADGVHRVWYDGELVLEITNLEFRLVDTLQFDTVGVEVFRGGGDLTYATSEDNTLDISDFRVYVPE